MGSRAEHGTPLHLPSPPRMRVYSVTKQATAQARQRSGLCPTNESRTHPMQGSFHPENILINLKGEDTVSLC